MFKEIIEKERYIFKDKIDRWEEAVRIAASPLLQQGAIEESYITAMIDCINEYGPYVVIAPDIAIPHARGEFGVNETSISFMKVEEPVRFGETPDLNARLIFVIAAAGDNLHIKLLQSLVEYLSQPEIVEKLLEASSIEELKNVLFKVSGV